MFLQFKVVRLASRHELQMVPEVGIEPTRDYSQGILSRIKRLLSTTSINNDHTLQQGNQPKSGTLGTAALMVTVDSCWVVLSASVP